MAMSQFEQVAFWSRQYDEHLQFLRDLFVEEDAKKEAASLQKAYSAMRKRALDDPPQAAAMLEAITRRVHEYQSAQLERLRAGEFLGWAFPTFVAHITTEIDLGNHLIYGDPAPAGGVASTVNRLGGEHALFLAHLLDPSEAELVRIGNDSAAALFALVPAMAPYTTAAALQEHLGKFLADNKVGTPQGPWAIINQALGEHVVREQYYFAQTLRS